MTEEDVKRWANMRELSLDDARKEYGDMQAQIALEELRYNAQSAIEMADSKAMEALFAWVDAIYDKVK